MPKPPLRLPPPPRVPPWPMKKTNEIIVSPAMIHHSHAECLRIDPIIVKNRTSSLACPKEHGKRKSAPGGVVLKAGHFCSYTIGPVLPALRQSKTFNCTVVRPLNSFSDGAKARSNFPTGSEPLPAFHHTASCVVVPSVTHSFTCCLFVPMRCKGFLCVRFRAQNCTSGLPMPVGFNFSSSASESKAISPRSEERRVGKE